MENEITKESMVELIKKTTNDLKMSLNTRIIPFCSTMNDEYIVGYATEPTREMKAFALAKAAKSPLIAGMELLNYCLIKDATDVRYFSTESKYDPMIFGAAIKIMDSIEIQADECIAIDIL